MNEPAESRREESATAGRASDVTSELGPETDREIRALLAANSPLHVMDIASAAERHPITVDLTCARLQKNGEVHPVGRGRYAITDGGNRQTGDGSES